MNEYFNDVLAGRKPDGSPIYVQDLLAALAPAAVVMPEPAAYRTIDEYGCCTLSVGKIHQDSRALVLADAVEYLNRRAIPAGLLEKAADLLKSYQQVIDGCHSSEIERFDYQPEVQGTADELRALLGKEGE